MAKGSELKGRIKSVENTRKITRTLEMIATSKMKRAQDRVIAARPYARALADVISSLYSKDLEGDFPLLRQPKTVKKAAVLLLTSNRGMAGGFNANLIKEARTLIKRLEGEGTMAAQRTDIGDKPTATDAASLVDALMAGYQGGDLDAVYVVCASYKSALSSPPISERV